MWTVLVLLGVLFGGTELWKRWRRANRAREEGWRLVAWRRLGFDQFEFKFQNGTVVRDWYYYPSGEFVGVFDEPHDRIRVIEKQLEFGQHAELEIKDDQ